MLAAAGKSAPPKAVITATRYVTGRFGLNGVANVRSRASRRKPAWALVTGSYRRPPPGGRFAVWVLLYDGQWLVKHAGLDGDAASPPASLRVPCDLRPAFGKPAC